MRGTYRWDDSVLDAIRRGVATRVGIKRELGLSQSSIIASLARLTAAGKVTTFTKGWYVACEK